MGILERNSRNIDNRYWNPGIKAFPVKNIYTAGVAGQRFFEELKENGKIYGSKCEKCGLTYVPARIYCEKCFNHLAEKDWVDVWQKRAGWTLAPKAQSIPTPWSAGQKAAARKKSRRSWPQS